LKYCGKTDHAAKSGPTLLSAESKVQNSIGRTINIHSATLATEGRCNVTMPRAFEGFGHHIRASRLTLQTVPVTESPRSSVHHKYPPASDSLHSLSYCRSYPQSHNIKPRWPYFLDFYFFHFTRYTKPALVYTMIPFMILNFVKDRISNKTFFVSLFTFISLLIYRMLPFFELREHRC
jgi:hypothetical protein